MLHIISMFTFPSDPSSFLFWRFISSTSQKLWFSPYAFKTLFIFTKWKYTHLKRFHVYKMAKTRFPSGFVLQNEKTSFRSVFHVYKKKTRFDLKRFHVNEMKNTLLKSFSCLIQHKKHVFEALFMFTKWKKVLKRFFHVYKTKITFLKRFSCFQNGKAPFGSVFHVYKI